MADGTTRSGPVQHGGILIAIALICNAGRTNVVGTYLAAHVQRQQRLVQRNRSLGTSLNATIRAAIFEAPPAFG